MTHNRLTAWQLAAGFAGFLLLAAAAGCEEGGDETLAIVETPEAAVVAADAPEAAAVDAGTIRVEEIPRGEAIGMVRTDKARYDPGEEVLFTADLPAVDQGVKLLARYKHLNRVVDKQWVEAEGPVVSWSWTPPPQDFAGYLAEVVVFQGEEATAQMNIAVDVSSDWTHFPRYGFLSDFGPMKEERIEALLDRLNRFHLNGIQFYDWQYKHHQPVRREGDGPADEWKDIANRPVAFRTVEAYIEEAHARNMAAMNYNLLFGAYEDAETDGADLAWGLYTEPLGERIDKHDLPASWASDILLMNPGNEEWRGYIFEEMQYAFDVLPFDGWHVDQLGSRGTRWDRRGVRIDLAKTYAPFLQHAKERLGGKTLVMNAVDQYGQGYIAGEAPVSFLYSEVWGTYPKYGDLKKIIDANRRMSGNRLNTVLAAYVNYQHAETPGMFNMPGVLLANAVIFASGGAHLELGEHMLSREYFPHDNLKMSAELERRLIAYYDFLVAYQNVLRGGLAEYRLEIESPDAAVSGEAEQGAVWAFGKRSAERDVIQLVNLLDAVTMDWNDGHGTQAAPTVRNGLRLVVKPSSPGAVKEVWAASPDVYGGSPVEAKFEVLDDGRLEIVVDRLEYWSMAVMEYE